jgi:hypothetical protein
MSESVRSRLAVEAGQNRGLNSDHAGETWGTLVVTNRVENARGVGSYMTKCLQCGQSGQRITQAQFEDNRSEIKCCNPGCGKQSDTRRTYAEAGVQQRVREDAVGSARQRIDAAAREAEIKAFEQEGQ